MMKRDWQLPALCFVTAVLLATAAWTSHRVLVQTDLPWTTVPMGILFTLPLALLAVRPTAAVRWTALAVCAGLVAHPWIQSLRGRTTDSIPCGYMFMTALWATVAFVQWRSILAPSKPANRCTNCGYDLTGNVSGVCPECGTACGAGKAKSGSAD